MYKAFMFSFIALHLCLVPIQRIVLFKLEFLAYILIYGCCLYPNVIFRFTYLIYLFLVQKISWFKKYNSVLKQVRGGVVFNEPLCIYFKRLLIFEIHLQTTSVLKY